METVKKNEKFRKDIDEANLTSFAEENKRNIYLLH